MDNIVNYLASLESAPEFQIRSADGIDGIDFKIFRDKCWEGKPLVLDLFTEIKANLRTCEENTDGLVQFMEHFLEKTFDFLCNVDKTSFKDDSGKEQPICEPQSAKSRIMCLAKYHPNGFDFGICE